MALPSSYASSLSSGVAFSPGPITPTMILVIVILKTQGSSAVGTNKARNMLKLSLAIFATIDLFFGREYSEKQVSQSGQGILGKVFRKVAFDVRRVTGRTVQNTIVL